MPDFAYIARDNSGQRVTGSVAATSEREVLSILSGKSLFPISVTLEKAQTNPLSRKRVGGQLMATTYSQLASLLRSGVPLLRSIHVLRHQTSNARLNEVLDDVHRRVEDGSTLAEAMGRYPRVFSEMAINMVRAGGEGGFLEDALERVSQFTEQQEDLKSRTAGRWPTRSSWPSLARWSSAGWSSSSCRSSRRCSTACGSGASCP